MTWAKFDDTCPEHPKVEALSDSAHRLWFNAVCYSNKMLTDGRITTSILKRLYHRRPLQAADELVKAGLWHEVADGFDIHDFLTYQPSREKVMAQRKAKEMAGAKGAASRWGNEKTNAPETDTESRPAPLASQDSSSSARVWFKKLTGRDPHNAAMRGVLENLDAAHPPECLTWAFESSASAQEPWPYAKRILDSCVLGGEGHGPRERQRAAHPRSGQGHPATANGRQVRRTSDFD